MLRILPQLNPVEMAPDSVGFFNGKNNIFEKSEPLLQNDTSIKKVMALPDVVYVISLKNSFLKAAKYYAYTSYFL